MKILKKENKITLNFWRMSKDCTFDVSYPMPSDNPDVGLAEMGDIEMDVEIVPGEPDTTSKILFMNFIKFSVVRPSTQ